MISKQNLKINKVVRMAQAFFNDRLRPLGLSSGLFYFILELAENDSVSMQELSRAVLVDNGHTTRAVGKLVRLGYLTKGPDPTDSRSSRVTLTRKGREAAETIQRVLTEWADLIGAGVTREEIDTVYRVFDAYYLNAERSSRRRPEGVVTS